MGGEHLIMHAADPMPPRADFAVRHRRQVFAERRAEGLEHLLWRVERNTSNQQEFTATHCFPPSLASIGCQYTLAARSGTKASPVNRFIRMALCCAIVAIAGPAGAQNWPSRPVKLIVPTGAGAATDVMARFVADGVSRTLGQPMFVENMPGASGILA